MIPVAREAVARQSVHPGAPGGGIFRASPASGREPKNFSPRQPGPDLDRATVRNANTGIMTRVELLLHPAAERNRSMVLYAERLAANQPDGESWQVRRLPSLPGRLGYRISEVVLPPLRLPFVESDVVHVMDHAHAGYLRYLRAPAVVTIHDLIPLKWLAGEYPVSERMPAGAAAWFRWNVAAVGRARKIVCPSAATAADVKRLLDLEALVVPHGIDEIFFAPPDAHAVAAVAARLGQHPTPTLLQVSTGPFYKNELAFLEVFVRAAAALPDLTWVRVGQPLPDRVRRQLDALVERVVEFGPATAAELTALYARATCLLFPSWDEGFGWPPLEAMAAGCPVVCSTGGALRETASPGALHAPAGDIDALATQVLNVLRDEPLREALRERGRAHAGTYRWSRAADAMRDVYRDAAG